MEVKHCSLRVAGGRPAGMYERARGGREVRNLGTAEKDMLQECQMAAAATGIEGVTSVP